MQTRSRQYISLFIASLSLFSTLVSVSPHIAIAAPAVDSSNHIMDSQSMMDMTVCALDCVQIENCTDHCMTDTEDDEQVAATIPLQTTISADAIEEAEFSYSIPAKQLFFLNTSDRAPPALVLIRSIRKLE